MKVHLASMSPARSAKSVETLAHVGMPRRKPHPNARRDRNHRRDSALTARANAAASTSAPTRIRSPAASTISMRPTGPRRRDWSGERPFVLDLHRQKLHRFHAAARCASRVPAPPGEQQIGIDAVALGHLRHGRGRREALGNHPPLLIARPEPTPMRSFRIPSLTRHPRLHR